MRQAVLQSEFTIKDWLRYRKDVPHAAIICGGVPVARPCQNLGFICRDVGGHYSCGRRCCACMGGDDNRCSSCWVELQKDMSTPIRRRRR